MIRIKFQIKNVRLEAISCLEPDEFSDNGEGVILRTALENTRSGPVMGSLLALISKNLNLLPAELEGYLLISTHRHPQDNKKVLSFAHFSTGWNEGWSSLDDHWGKKTLVLRCYSR